jgi:hypothetical protein
MKLGLPFGVLSIIFLLSVGLAQAQSGWTIENFNSDIGIEANGGM